MMTRPPDGQRFVSPEELDRERLQTYIDWAQVRAPWWFWPIYALSIAAWFVGYGFGPQWSIVGAVVIAMVAGAGMRAMSDQGQVSLPRFRGMPRQLRRAYLPVLVAGIGFVAAIFYVVIAASAPYVLLGMGVGATMAGSGMASSQWFRVEAARLAREHGLRT